MNDGLASTEMFMLAAVTRRCHSKLKHMPVSVNGLISVSGIVSASGVVSVSGVVKHE